MRILYLGTDPTQFKQQLTTFDDLIHFPIIKIVPRPFSDLLIRRAFADVENYTHFIFTSKHAVKIFREHLNLLNQTLNVSIQRIFAIGKVTAHHLTTLDLSPHFIAAEETQEGVLQLLCSLDLKNAYIFIPRSAISRPLLIHFLEEKNIRFVACDLYDTVTNKVDVLPDLNPIDEIVFTSPSTVKAFIEIFGALPLNKKLTPIGPITAKLLLGQIFKTING